ncbi:pseudouridine-5-phosphate glycosidase [Nakamurella sp. YIM 132087]|uniref:Pseudouridine-5'-phosphate glycosidase n=1 Tax=Nakamurella alba TaxID=2665158 RepID=A0A7K1FIE4_9ACTN|nr:pseudouridine-5'-phosphate glycosidase [Nakamurella alba]MTD13219.1 pseudouridine-5-phosphate glycosidase [Nakamurella alba]
MPPTLLISDPVAAALAENRPVVALESTIFTHGLPQPRNLEVALEAEDQLRSAGVEPATIGVVDGVPVVGLSTDEIVRLAAAPDNLKISIRDLPVARATGRSGGTTVAATALLAHRAGVKVFSTGGLGGVHRGASETFDESADLVALSVTPIVVVSAGVKSILDVGATLERLETLNITVLGYRTTTFPGFYVRDSGFEIGFRVDDPAEVAAVASARDELGLDSAVLVANPISEELQLDPQVHAEVLAQAIAGAEAAGITGNATTPYLLDHIQRVTGGRSLDVNVDVYRGNVGLGGEIAAALAKG